MTKQSLTPMWKKVLICALALLAVGVAAFTTYAIIQNEYRCSGKWDEVIYSNNHVVIRGHYKHWRRQSCTMHSAVTGKKLVRRFLSCGSQAAKTDTLMVYFDFHDKRGYLDVQQGKIAIPAQYDHAWNFSEGLGAITRDNKVGFINSKGEEVIPCQFPTTLYAINRFGFAFHDSLCVMTNERNQCGIIDRQGKWVVEPIYDCIWNANKAGLRIVQNNGYYGIMDKRGNILYPIQYDQISDQGGYYVVENLGIRYTMDYRFQVINSFVCDRIDDLLCAGDDGTYYPTGLYKFYIGYQEGIMDSNAHILVPAIYYQVEMLNPKIIKVTKNYNDPCVLLDLKGRPIQVTR